MPEHETPHLTDGQIVALSGSGGDRITELHIDSCAQCRERLAQWRDACARIAPIRAPYPAAPALGCPAAEDLANYASGVQETGLTETIAAHLVDCDRCAAIVRDALEAPDGDTDTAPLLQSSSRAWRRNMAQTFAASARPSASVYRRYLAAAAAVVTVAGSLTVWWIERAPNTATLLARAYTASRPFEYRLPDSGYAPVRQQRGNTSSFARPESLDTAVAAIRRDLAAHPQDPSLLAMKGRAELLDGDFESAIESLTRATAEPKTDPTALADLAAAYALRGEAEKRGVDYEHAIELFLQAKKKLPTDPRIQFNLALTYEKLWLVDEAIDIWHQFLNGNPPPGWREEAQTHLAAMEKVKAGKKQSDARILHDPARFLASYGSAGPPDPLPWFEIFWMEWSPRTDSDKAAAQAARSIATAFTRYGEHALLETLDAPQSPARSTGLSLLAKVMAANREGHPGDALATARDAAAKLDQAGLHAAAALARNEFVYAARWAARNRECVETSNRLLRAIGPGHSWIEGNAHLEHSACLLRVGKDGAARIEMERARENLARAGLWPVALRASQWIAGADGYSGNYVPVWETAPDGLRNYWTTPASGYRAQAFQFSMEQAAAGLDWLESAAVFYRAAIRSDQSVHNEELEVSNRSGLAQILHRLGDYSGEMRELDKVERLLDHAGLNPEVKVLRWEAGLARVEAEISTGSARDPMPELDRLAASAEGNEARQQLALHQARGLAFMAHGDSPRAMKAFDSVIELDRKQAQSEQSWVRRMPLIELGAPAYQNLTQLELLQDHDPAKALSIWRQFRPGTPPSRRSITMAALPAGIAIWTSDGAKVQARWADRAPALQQAAREFLALCASPASDSAEIRRLGALLYDALLRPELTALGAGTVLLTTDSWLAEIPFAALSDDSGQFLFHRFQFVQAYGPAFEKAAAPITAASPALIVAAPRAVAPGQSRLPFLPAAEPEAAAVSARFSHATLQRDATLDSLNATAPQAAVFHFCGHGWANGGNGALVLPPGPDGEPRYVTSRNLAGQNWSRCQLAVLSACLTAAGERRGAVNNQSLVQALLSAGARRVLAARWSVDSGATRALMDSFYARLVSGKSVPEALSGAAADVAASPNWSHPYFWAGFDVFGSA